MTFGMTDEDFAKEMGLDISKPVAKPRPEFEFPDISERDEDYEETDNER